MALKHKGDIGKHIADNLVVQLHSAYFNKVHEGWSLSGKRREFNQLYLFKGGEGFLDIEGERFRPKPGELYLIPAGTVRSYGTEGDNRFVKYWVHFSAKVGTVNVFDLLPVSRFIANSGDNSWLEERFRQLSALYREEGLPGQLKAKAVLLDIIAWYLENTSADYSAVQPARMKKNEQLSAVLHMMESRYREPLTVKELADTVHLHPNYFIKLFRSVLGVPPIVYLTRMRIDRARDLLVTTRLPIAEVAGSVGMELGYFSRMFKQLSGYSPTAFRKTMCDPSD
jgi:AraC-like DNA-binding protein